MAVELGARTKRVCKSRNPWRNWSNCYWPIPRCYIGYVTCPLWLLGAEDGDASRNSHRRSHRPIQRQFRCHIWRATWIKGHLESSVFNLAISWRSKADQIYTYWEKDMPLWFKNPPSASWSAGLFSNTEDQKDIGSSTLLLLRSNSMNLEISSCIEEKGTIY